MTAAGPAPALLLVKPAGADCNLDCDYCFYLERPRPRGGGPRRMSPEVLERMINSYLELPAPVHSFCWQGGEPTLMGLDFYHRVVELQQQYGRPGTVIANSLQTNAVLIDDAFAEHLAGYRFLVGCSLDGPAELHDRYRRDRRGWPSHAKTLAGIAALQRHGVAVNALTLVSSANVDHPREVYDHLLETGFSYLQFIPCVEFDDRGQPEPWTVTAEQWGVFLCGIFDAWRDGGMSVSVRNFDTVLQRLVDDTPGDCTMADDCRQYLVVEHDGDLYPCDFHVDESQRLGNIMDLDPAQAMASPRMQKFGRGKRTMSPLCPDCRHFEICRGGCPAHRDPGSDEANEWLCRGILDFLDHARTPLADLAAAISRTRGGRL